MKINGKDHLLPVAGVGSWPRPTWMQGQVFGTVNEPDYRSFLDREKFEDSTRIAVEDQDRLGYDVVGDGQQYYESATPYDYEVFLHHLPNRIAGTVPYGPPLPIPELSKFSTTTVVDELTWVRPIFGPIMEVVTRYTAKPRKLALFSPAGMMVCLTDRHYGSPEKLAFALAGIYNRELKDLCARKLIDIVQFLDIGACYTSAPYMTDVINAAVDGLDCDVWMHACQGNAGDRFYVEGDQSFLFPSVYGMKANLFHIALAHPLRAPDVKLFLEHPPPPEMTIGAGVVCVKDPTPEKVDDVVARIERLLEVLPPEQICLMPDCGWGNRRRDTVHDKSQVLVEAASFVRSRYQ